jgi:hypothetical protein
LANEHLPEVKLDTPDLPTTTPLRRSDTAPTRLDRFAAITVLVAFGITWPVLEILANNAEFFLARNSSQLEIVLVATGLAVVLPALVGLLGTLPGRLGVVIGTALVGLGVAALAHLLLARSSLPWWLALVGAAAAGVGGAIGFERSATARRVGRYLLPAPLLLLAFFAVATPSGEILLDRGAGVGTPIAVANPVPVVMLVLDEFPVASIMDPDGNLREELYPGFARLASDGVWFRNAVTVEQQTEHSVPAMLTGSVPDQALSPFAGHYPNSLFTALSGTYDLAVNETITQLCPRRLCEKTTVAAAPVTDDILVVAGHVLLPDPLTRSLPPIDGTWGNFDAIPEDFDVVDEFQRNLQTDRRGPMDDWVARIAEGADAPPPFYFLHALVPHHPWEFLPDGRKYPLVISRNPASSAGGWIDDDFLVAQGMQRHLLQVGYADHLVGRMIAALEAAGIYEEAMVVVVADHGIAIKPGVTHQRTITETSIGEIAAVPLFVKAPGEAAGVIDDRRALTIDIVPTIADVLGADLPWETEGASLFGPAPDRTETTTVGPKGAVTFGVDGEEKLGTAARVEDWFPGGDPWALRPEGSPDLIGQTLDVSSLDAATITARLRSPELYEGVDASGDGIPVRLAGRLEGAPDDPVVLAVTINGTVGAITRSYRLEDEVWFMAMVPPELYVEGDNTVELAQVMPDGEMVRVEIG